MQVFSIYASKNNKENVIVLKEGFSIEAFILGPIWAFYKQMWLIGSISIIIYIVSNSMKNYIPEFFTDVFNNIVLLLYGFFASDLISYKLNNNGYQLEDIVIAKNQDEAELAFLNKNKQ